MSNTLALWWLYWCPGLTPERWQEECRLVEERFSLFRPFAEAPFFGFRGIVSRSASIYNITVAAVMRPDNGHLLTGSELACCARRDFP
jgi:hypothetical protein